MPRGIHPKRFCTAGLGTRIRCARIENGLKSIRHLKEMKSDSYGTASYSDLAVGFEPSTMVELLRKRALNEPTQIGYIYLTDDGKELATLGYEALDRKARAIAARLCELEADRGRTLLLFPPGLDFIAGLFGCFYAKSVAIPAYPPDPGRLSRTVPRLQKIAADAQATVALTTSDLLSYGEASLSRLPGLDALKWVPTDNISLEREPDWDDSEIDGESLVFFQYTSGSTDSPKGVMLSHSNLLSNCRLVSLAFEHSKSDKYVSWLPTYHDMGLMAGVLQPLYSGIPAILMSPIAFMNRPTCWLKAISKYKATTSGGPNFAFDLCARKTMPEDLRSLDLSSWTVAFSGAEPVRNETIERFTRVFEPCGFRREAFYPCYGLAEATLIVSGGLKTASPKVRTVRARDLEQRQVVEGSVGSDKVRNLASCGRTLSDQKIVIADPESLLRCADRQIGEIWVSGRSVALGYWNRREETQKTFLAHLSDSNEGPYLRTGDLGFLEEGELYVTGRIKDLIIIRGLNHYPQDIECTVERCHAALRPGCGAAFSIDVEGEERLVVVQEVDRSVQQDLGPLLDLIKKKIAEHHEIQPHAIVLIKQGTIYKTSSGKIQRHACRQAFLQGRLDAVSLWMDELSTTVAPNTTTTINRSSSEEIAGWLLSYVSKVIGIHPPLIDPDKPLIGNGLDSLRIIDLIHGIEEAFGASIRMSKVWEGISITDLAAMIAQQIKEAPPDLVYAAGAADGGAGEQPLSAGQKGLWFAVQLDQTAGVYNIARAIKVISDLDVPALRKAFQGLISRHPALRTCFVAKEGAPSQQVRDRVELDFHEEDASGWSEPFLERRLNEEANHSFRLEDAPLMRLTLFAIAPKNNVLVLNIHHIVADFWSLAVLLKELDALYNSEKARIEASLPPLDWQYSDYVRRQAEMLASAEGEGHWDYWRQCLAGSHPILRLPADRRRPETQTFRGSSQGFELTPELSSGIKELARAQQTTMFVVLLSAFLSLLYRYTEQEDMLVGSPSAGRDLSRSRWVMGYFVNPVVLRADLSGSPPFLRFLQQMRQKVLEALEHQEYPFPLLVERLRPPRIPNISPIFQVMFCLQKAPILDEDGLAPFVLGEHGGRIRLGELEFESVKLGERKHQFDITIEMIEAGGSTQGSLQYNPDLFDGSTIARVARHLQTLLGNAIDAPNQPVSHLSLMEDGERREVLSKWNQTRASLYHYKSFHASFQSQAKKHADSIAVADKENALTYSELNIRANQLAHYLSSIGVGPESVVGLCIERSVNVLIGILGIHKAGGAFLPLDPIHPPKRLAFMLEDSGALAVLIAGESEVLFEGCRTRIVSLEGDLNRISPQRGEDLIQGSSGELAYVIYTSGSTGRPKGVMVHHQGLANYLEWCAGAYRLAEQHGAIVHTSIAFDLTITSLLSPLLAGKRVEVLDDTAGIDGLAAALQREHGPLLLKLTPGHLDMLAKEVEPEAARNVSLMIVGGEALSSESVTAWLDLAPNTEVINEYGPTESVVGCCVYRFEPPKPGVSEVPIGRPVANVGMYLLDNQIEPVPFGVPGGLYICGIGLARGYIGRPDWTADRFLPDPFSEEPGNRMYQTGDLGRSSDGSNIEFLRRADGQLKVRGYRIEPGEIEAILEEQVGVMKALVTVSEDRQKQLIAYFMADESCDIGADGLRQVLKQKVPAYMVPAAFIKMASFPLTQNGKLDRRSLPVPDGVRPDLKEVYVAPRTRVEEQLAGIWKEVLGIDKVGIHDNFFDLGGHSLLGTQLISRMRKIFNVDVPLRSIFDYPTLDRLAGVVNRAATYPDEGSAPKIERVTRGAASIQDLLRKVGQRSIGTS